MRRVALICTVDRDLEAMAFLDIGMFMQTLMLVAADRGLDTCAQGCAEPVLDRHAAGAAIPEGEHVIAGMALGYADPDALVNAAVSARESLDVFATFHDEEG